MTIKIGPELESLLSSLARKSGTTPEELAVAILIRQTQEEKTPRLTQEEFRRHLQAAASPCGVSLTDEDLSRETLYD